MNHRNLANYLFYSIMFLFAMVLTILSPLLTEIAKTYSLSMAQTGVIFTANFIGFVLFILIGGILADRLGKRLIMAISLAGFALSMLLLPLASNFYTALIMIISIGGFGGSIQSTVSALIADVNTDNPSFYLNSAQVFFGLGAIIGPMGAGILLTAGFSWQVCYFILGGLALVVTAGFVMIKLPPVSKSEKITWTSFTKLAVDPKLLIVCLCMFLYTGSEVGGWGWMSAFLKQNLKFTATKSSIAIALFWGGMTIGRFICGRLSLRYNIRNIIIGLAFSSTVVTVLSGFVVSEFVVLANIVAMGFAYSSLWPMIASYGGNYHQEYSGTVYALLVSSGGVGAMIIPFIMGVLAQNINIRMAMISPGIAFLLIALIFLNLKKLPGEKEIR